MSAPNPHSNNPMRSSGSNVAGRTTMSILRALDPVLQYEVLKNGYAASILNTLGAWRVTPLPLVSRVGLNSLSSTFLQRPGNVLVVASVLGAIKHVWWATFTCNNAFPLPMGASVGVYNNLLSLINSLVLAYGVSHGTVSASGWKQFLGLAMVLLGNGAELWMEESRKAFKAKKINQGKIDDTGAFGVVRHPNYLAYSVSRVGAALITGSFMNTAIQAIFQVATFTLYSIPELSGYMSSRYGAEYERYAKNVPYKFIPFIY